MRPCNRPFREVSAPRQRVSKTGCGKSRYALLAIHIHRSVTLLGRLDKASIKGDQRLGANEST
jgi:hypothetical protein